MYHLYRVTNTITGEYYIGVHKHTNVMDNYLGSGVRIKRSITKYGKENFVKHILEIFDTEEDAFNKEKIILSDHLHQIGCLNLAEGGKGGSNFSGKMHSEETKEKIARASRGRKFKKSQEAIDNERQSRYARNGGKWFSADTIEKLRQKALMRNK